MQLDTARGIDRYIVVSSVFVQQALVTKDSMSQNTRDNELFVTADVYFTEPCCSTLHKSFCYDCDETLTVLWVLAFFFGLSCSSGSAS